MSILSTVREAATRATEARLGYAPGERGQILSQLELVQESIADLELRREDAGWKRLVDDTRREFTRDGLRTSADICRAMALSSPLIKRGLAVRASYVWGQGVGVTAEATGEDGTQDVNAVIQAFLDDDGNRRAYTGHQAHLDMETALGTDGNLFIAHFTDPRTGRVQARRMPFDEIEDIITNPEDASEPWYYLRVWTERTVTAGQTSRVSRKAYYPALSYRPVIRQRTIDGVEVRWDAPVLHVHDNGLADATWGVGDVYASVPWVRAHEEYLRDWVKLMRALARISFRISGKDKAATLRAQAATAQALQARDAGGALAMTGADIDAVPKSGASIDAESGRPLIVMVAAGLGIPLTTLTGDPGQTGARATAETLDEPMKLELTNRRELWTEALRASLGYVIDQSAIAPAGALRGTVRRDGGRQIVDLAGDTERTLAIEWPALDEMTQQEAIEAIATANDTGLIPPATAARLLLRALRVRDVDELIDDMTDDHGNFIPPDAALGDALIAAHQRGETP
ncbi:MAG: hypothetical protein L0I17_08160 [Actinomycetia bacterium]|nr:hypothetical protein [Actinomycetes bacterium]